MKTVASIVAACGGLLLVGCVTSPRPGEPVVARMEAQGLAADPEALAPSRALPLCEMRDWNGDGVFPDNTDLEHFFFVYGGGACPTAKCKPIDINGDGVFPELADVTDLLNLIAGGPCRERPMPITPASIFRPATVPSLDDIEANGGWIPRASLSQANVVKYLHPTTGSDVGDGSDFNAPIRTQARLAALMNANRTQTRSQGWLIATAAGTLTPTNIGSDATGNGGSALEWDHWGGGLNNRHWLTTYRLNSGVPEYGRGPRAEFRVPSGFNAATFNLFSRDGDPQPKGRIVLENLDLNGLLSRVTHIQATYKTRDLLVQGCCVRNGFQGTANITDFLTPTWAGTEATSELTNWVFNRNFYDWNGPAIHNVGRAQNWYIQSAWNVLFHENVCIMGGVVPAGLRTIYDHDKYLHETANNVLCVRELVMRSSATGNQHRARNTNSFDCLAVECPLGLTGGTINNSTQQAVFGGGWDGTISHSVVTGGYDISAFNNPDAAPRGIGVSASVGRAREGRVGTLRSNLVFNIVSGGDARGLNLGESSGGVPGGPLLIEDNVVYNTPGEQSFGGTFVGACLYIEHKLDPASVVRRNRFVQKNAAAPVVQIQGAAADAWDRGETLGGQWSLNTFLHADNANKDQWVRVRNSPVPFATFLARIGVANNAAGIAAATDSGVFPDATFSWPNYVEGVLSTTFTGTAKQRHNAATDAAIAWLRANLAGPSYDRAAFETHPFRATVFNSLARAAFGLPNPYGSAPPNLPPTVSIAAPPEIRDSGDVLLTVTANDPG